MESGKLVLHFIDGSGRTILKKKLTGLPLKEKIILAKSEEWFFDPEPCMIHRSAVMKRIYLEISEYLEELLKRGIQEQSWGNLPDHIRNILDVRDEISFIRLETSL